MSWSPLRIHSYYSLNITRGLNSPKSIVKLCKEYGYESAAITDFNTLAGCVSFYQECKKNDIKPILGVDLVTSKGERKVVYAKNLNGWKSLIKLVSHINQYDSINEKFFEDVIVCEGDIEQDIYYNTIEDAKLHRIVLCSAMKMDMQSAIDNDNEYSNFFNVDNYYMPTPSEVENNNLGHITNTDSIVSQCEDYEILSPPKLPEFVCPDGFSQYDYLLQLCREGWKRRLSNTDRVDTKEKEDVYSNRIKEELAVIKDADLSGYFLIVQDIVMFGKNKGWILGPGRGSAAGCLISFLIGITDIDPIKHNLLFSRFYNASRKGSLPDVDMDVPSKYREQFITYIRNKYGSDRVAQMITFNRLMGRSSMKEVLRIEGDVSFAEMNDITQFIPDVAEVADELDSVENRSVILWSLQNRPNKFSKWCELDKDGNLTGELADIFTKAIALEGTPKSQGKHAAGIIITSGSMYEACPILFDKDNNPVAGFEMAELESLGEVKLDLLGIDLLDKIMEIYEDMGLKVEDVDFEDKEVWDMLSDGDTKGIFQLERQSRWTKKLKPQNLDHLAALISIIRPGVVEATEDGKSMTQHYVDRKNGDSECPSIHKDIDAILHETYGVLCYQETAMRLAREVAGFTLDEADILRKAIGKKKVDLMAQVKTDYIEKSKEKGKYSKEIYEKIFDWIEKSQRYSFNASHAYSYAYDAYYSAYAKKHNPVKFYEVYLNHAHKKIDQSEEIYQLINDARLRDIDVLPPDLCNLYKDFTIVDDRKIVYGLSHIKNIGDKDSESINELIDGCEKDFCDFTWLDILNVLGPKVNKRAFNALIMTGSLTGDNNLLDRERMVYEYLGWKNLTKREYEFIKDNVSSSETLESAINIMANNVKISAKRMDKVLSIIQGLKNPEYDLADNPISVCSAERKYFGLPLSHKTQVTHITGDSTCRDVHLGYSTGVVNVVGNLRSVREHKIKKDGKNYGKSMAFLEMQDSSGSLSNIVMFPDIYESSNYMLYDNNLICIKGKVERRNGDFSLLVEKVFEV